MSYEEKTDELATPSLTNFRLLKVAGIGMAGLLALSACATVGEDDDADADGQEQADTDDDPAEAPEDAEGAEDQVPALEDIEDDIFDVMLNAENVTMTGEGDALDEDFSDFADEEDEEFVPEETVFTLAGTLDGSASQVQFSFGGQELEFLQTEDQVFLTGETAVFFLEQETPEDILSEIDMDAVTSELSGAWVDMTDEMGGPQDDFRLDTVLSDMQEEFQDPDEDSLFPWTAGDYPEGTAEEREGQEVWVYGQDGNEVVVAADEEEPYILTVDGEDEDGNPVLITFTEWDETDIPESPEDDEVLTSAELEGILLDNMV